MHPKCAPRATLVPPLAEPELLLGDSERLPGAPGGPVSRLALHWDCQPLVLAQLCACIHTEPTCDDQSQRRAHIPAADPRARLHREIVPRAPTSPGAVEPRRAALEGFAPSARRAHARCAEAAPPLLSRTGADGGAALRCARWR